MSLSSLPVLPSSPVLSQPPIFQGRVKAVGTIYRCNGESPLPPSPYLSANVRDVVVDGPVLGDSGSSGAPRNPARRLEDRSDADETQEPSALSESWQRRQHLEGEPDVV